MSIASWFRRIYYSRRSDEEIGEQLEKYRGILVSINTRMRDHEIMAKGDFEAALSSQPTLWGLSGYGNFNSTNYESVCDLKRDRKNKEKRIRELEGILSERQEEVQSRAS